MKHALWIISACLLCLHLPCNAKAARWAALMGWEMHDIGLDISAYSVNKSFGSNDRIVFSDSPNLFNDSADIDCEQRLRWYPYPDTVRYSFDERDGFHNEPLSYDFYEGDTATLRFDLFSLADSLYYNVGNHLPDSIYFRVFKYSDFNLDDSIYVPTGDLTFIYRGKSDGGGVPTTLDSNNFHLYGVSVQTWRDVPLIPYEISIFYDIVGLEAGIYEILPTFTMFNPDSQEYGYSIKTPSSYRDNSGVLYEIWERRRSTMPLYIREKRGWIDSVNVYISDAVRYGVSGQMNTALYWAEQALKLYSHASFAVEVKSWIYRRNSVKDLADLTDDLFNQLRYKYRHWDWYLERYYKINQGIIRWPVDPIYIEY